MTEKANMKEVRYVHLTLQGSPYEAGRAQGELLGAVPGWAQFLGSGKGAFTPQEFKRLRQTCERFLPGINEEIHGMADALGVAVEDVIYYAASALRKPGCSQMAVLPSASVDGHVLAGRTFDFSDRANDFRLVTTRIAGKLASIGSSIMIFGRSEGMNEHGLSVTTSSGGIPVGEARPAIQDGFQFWALTRALLDTCRNVDEALNLIREFPLACNPVYILADRAGNAALVEIYGERRAEKRFAPGEGPGWLCAANHFTLPGMDAIEPLFMRNSPIRRERMERMLAEKAPHITRRDMKELMSVPYPEGLCCHAYDEYFGMLHAAVFDLTAGEAEVCFGSAAYNAWHTFRLDGAQEPQEYTARLPMEKAPADFF